MSKQLRILDLGCHDGYVSLWLARKLKEKLPDVDLAIDGIELNPEAAAKAQARLEEEEVAGQVLEGDALQAARLFQPGAYDAVVCFELIEHVPEPAKLLAVAERMVRAGGRVYISTPDGTFGDGNNPHHLRVYRAQDLADTLRRRGRLSDMTVGRDGVTIASYVPEERRGEIAIYLGPGWERFSPHDIERKGLGGSETAAIRVAEQLSELGYIVTVYGEVEECAYRDVIFKRHTAFDPTERRLAVIASRIPELFDRPINCRTRMLWLHDTDCGDRLTPRRADPIDHVLVLSEWHEAHVAGMYPFVKDKLRRTRNGIELSYFAGEELEREHQVIYSSSPDRGLDKLLEMWPQVLKEVPDAKLVHCYSAVYDAIAEQRPEISEHRELVRRLTEKTKNVVNLGHLNQPQLAHVMRQSMVWAHPSFATPYDGPFHETSCIGAMEAQAAGCLAIGSNWGALPETIDVGRLIDAPANSRRWWRAFVREIVDGLTNEETQEWVQREGPKAVAEMGWDGVAKQLAGLIEGEVHGFEDAAVPERDLAVR